MEPEELILPSDGSCEWAGMGDYVLISPDANHRASLLYAGEPPHGDSYHKLTVDGKKFPGYAWGCLFAYSKDSRYLALSWMEKLVERKTVVIDSETRKYFVLPEYIHSFNLVWPVLHSTSQETKYEFDGSETWIAY